MAGLGNYVHYRRQNYYNYGISRRGQTGGYTKDISGAIAAQRKQTKTLIDGLKNDVKIKELERSLNNLRDTGSIKDGEYNNEVLTRLSNQYYKYIEEQLPNLINKTNFADLSIASNENEFISRGLRKYNNLVAGKYNKADNVRISTLKKIKDSILQNIQRVETQIKQGTLTVDNFEEIKKRFHEVRNKIHQEILKAKAEGKKELKLGTDTDPTPIKSILKEYNQLVAITKYPGEKELGDIGEAQLAILGLYMQDKSQNITKDLIEKTIVGKQHLSTNTNFSYLGQDVAKAFNGTFSINGNQVNFRTHSPQTIDVIFTIPEEDGGQQEIRASVKNYENATASSRNISLIDGTNLVSMLTFGVENFGNHYLNVITQHSPKPGLIDTPKFEDMERELKRLTMARGLIGYRGNNSGIGEQNYANTFIVNDRIGGKGRFRVYSIKDLAQTAWADIDQYTALEGLPNRGDIKNVWSNSGPEYRLAKILQDVHAIKLKMSLKGKALKT